MWMFTSFSVYRWWLITVTGKACAVIARRHVLGVMRIMVGVLIVLKDSLKMLAISWNVYRPLLSLVIRLFPSQSNSHSRQSYLHSQPYPYSQLNHLKRSNQIHNRNRLLNLSQMAPITLMKRLLPKQPLKVSILSAGSSTSYSEFWTQSHLHGSFSVLWTSGPSQATIFFSTPKSLNT